MLYLYVSIKETWLHAVSSVTTGVYFETAISIKEKTVQH